MTMKKITLTLIVVLISVTVIAQSSTGRLRFASNYGFFVADGIETGLPALVPATDLRLKMIRPNSSYKFPQSVTLQVVDADGQLLRENTFSVSASSGRVDAIPAAELQGGDVIISGDLVVPETFQSNDYVCAFRDEFDGENHSQPDSQKWERAAHNNNSAWNRYISTSDKVVYLEDGDLVTRCIPCAEEDRESNKDHITGNYRDWMSGAVDTRGLYSFQYGRVDVRSLTNPFTGSFPAIWMLPDDQSAGWPQYGEIDIWEMVNTSNTAHGTIHAQRESQYTKNIACNYDGLYHVFTFEWTATQMKWSIDGKTAYSTHSKSSYSAAQLEQGFWPFDKKYYLILNQSVGMGGWAAYPVAGHEYETRFDFVRIYQKPSQNPMVGLSSVAQETAVEHSSRCYDLQGRECKASQAMKSGIIISDGKKYIK